MESNLGAAVPTRVFVVGPTRSGTSLVQRLVAERYGLLGIPETHFLDGNFSRRMRHISTRPEAAVTPFGASDPPSWFDTTTYTELVDSLKQGGSPIEFVRSVFEPVDRLSESKGLAGWVEKTPAHARFVPLIRAAYPEATIIHVYRNPADAVRSRQKAAAEWGRPRSWYQSYAQWLVAAWIGTIRSAVYDESWLNFEQLVATGGELPGDLDLTIKRADHVSAQARQGLLDEVDLSRERWRQNSLLEVDPALVTTTSTARDLSPVHRAALLVGPNPALRSWLSSRLVAASSGRSVGRLLVGLAEPQKLGDNR